MHAVDCHVQLFGTPWTVALQAPVSMGFSRQEYCMDCHALVQRIFPTQGLNPPLLRLLHVLFTTSATWEDQMFSRSLNRNQRLLGGMTGYTSECLKPLLRRECMEKQGWVLKCLGCWTKFGITMSESEGEKVIYPQEEG